MILLFCFIAITLFTICFLMATGIDCYIIYAYKKGTLIPNVTLRPVL